MVVEELMEFLVGPVEGSVAGASGPQRRVILVPDLWDYPQPRESRPSVFDEVPVCHRSAVGDLDAP